MRSHAPASHLQVSRACQHPGLDTAEREAWMAWPIWDHPIHWRGVPAVTAPIPFWRRRGNCEAQILATKEFFWTCGFGPTSCITLLCAA